MKIVAFQFCPSCGEYWAPGDRGEAADHKKQICRTCDVKVEYSWLGYGVAGGLLALGLATSIFPSAVRFAIPLLVVTLALAAYKAVRQHRAAKA